MDGGQDAGTPGNDGGPNDTDAGPQDAGPPPICPGSSAAAVSTGKVPAEFLSGSPIYFGDALAFVIRDAGGLYAMSAICTHSSCAVHAQGSGFLCPCHQSQFNADGTVLQGPATLPLVHYSLCLSESGQVLIDKTVVVDKSTRLND